MSTQRGRLQLVVVVCVVGKLDLDTLALAGLEDEATNLGSGIEGRATGENLPVVEDGLREGLARGGLAQIGVETERLQNGEVGLDVEERGTRALLLVEDVTTTTGQDTVDTTHGLLGNLNLDKVDRLEKSGLSEEGRGVEDTTGSGHDLTGTTMNGISVEGDIEDVEADGAHGLLSKGTLARGPLETRDDGVLDFVEVLDSTGLVNQQVGTGAVRTEAPNLLTIGDIPAEVVSESTGTGLEVVTGSDLAGLDGERELLVDGLSSHVDTVVLVGRLGQGSHAGLAGDGLTVLDDGVGDDEGNTGVVLLKILQANLEMQLTGTGDDVLTRLVGHGQDTGVRLGETLETLDKLGEILAVLDLDGTLDDRGDGELHDTHVVGSLRGGDGTRLEQELIDTNKTDNVTSRHVVNGLDLATHHEDGTLDGLEEEIILLARGVVGALDADLEAGADGTGENTAEGVETALIGGRHHLRDVQHEGTLGVAVTDTDGTLVVHGTLVESLGTVLLGGDGRRKVQNHHLKETVSGGKESAENSLEELLAVLGAVLGAELELKLVEEGGDLLSLEVHDSGEDLEDGVQNELVESTLKRLALVGAVLGPLLGVGVEVVVALRMLAWAVFGLRREERAYPETLHHLGLVDTKLLGVTDSELTDGEGPAVETGTESDGTLVGVDLDITESLVEVGGDDDVDGLNGTGEGLVQVLLGDLELEKSTVDLVDDNNGLNTLTKSLTQDSLGLDADTLDGVDDDESTVSDTEGSSDFRGEINVTGGVNEVDQEVLAVGLLANNVLDVLGVLKMTVQGDGGGLDGDTTLLLIGTGIGGTGITSLSGGDDTGLGEKGVGKSRLAVIDVGNDGHVTDVAGLVHEGAHLVDGETAGKAWLVSCFFERLNVDWEL